MYEVFYGKRVLLNWEISRLLCSSNDYLFPKGLNSVYYVDPKQVLTRPFDKIILLQRPYKEIRTDIYERLKIKKIDPEIDKKIKFYYSLIYEQKLKDPRLFRVNLQDFADYPIATFSDLFDFLEIPKKHRPIIYPFPIWHHSEDEEYKALTPKLHRDWKKRSTILRKGHEEQTIEKDEYTQIVNVEQIHAYKLTPEEFHYQKGRVYRIGRDTEDALEVMGYFD